MMDSRPKRRTRLPDHPDKEGALQPLLHPLWIEAVPDVADKIKAGRACAQRDVDPSVVYAFDMAVS